MPEGRRLSADDWVDAGLRALDAGGPDAVAVERLAASLGATKGSGYWHWPSRAALLEAVLARWRATATDEVIDRVEASGADPATRLRRLLSVVTDASERSPGTVLTLTHPDEAVRTVVADITHRRIGYVAALLRESGVSEGEARRRAVLVYAAYLGHAQLATTVPDTLPGSPDARRALRETVVDLLASAR